MAIFLAMEIEDEIERCFHI